MNNFHAGSSFEPLPDGKTRIKTYADGGRLLSNDLVTTEEAVRQIRVRQLPEQVIVKPRLEPLNPESEWDDRDMVTGHIISAGAFIFPSSGTSSVFKEYSEGVRAWMAENGYTHTSDLKNGYMATPGLHGIWTKEV